METKSQLNIPECVREDTEVVSDLPRRPRRGRKSKIVPSRLTERQKEAKRLRNVEKKAREDAIKADKERKANIEYFRSLKNDPNFDILPDIQCITESDPKFFINEKPLDYWFNRDKATLIYQCNVSHQEKPGEEGFAERQELIDTFYKKYPKKEKKIVEEGEGGNPFR